MTALGIFILLAFAFGWLYKKGAEPKWNPEDRCPVCGYLKDGPLHKENECEARRKTAEMSLAQLEADEIHAINRDVFGF